MAGAIGAMDAERRVAVVGATSLVGEHLLPLLAAGGWQVTALSRQGIANPDVPAIRWQRLPAEPPVAPANALAGVQAAHWVFLAPLWVLPDCFAALVAGGARRVVALSSTSRFTKAGSPDAYEQDVAARLAAAETAVRTWAALHGIETVILRPTLIYGGGRDGNVAEIARFVRRFGFFPLFGEARGRRQPVHAADVARACVAALGAAEAAGKAYDLSGGETLSYREMVRRIFAALGRPARLLPVPLWAFRLAVAALRVLPRYRRWSAAMAERMNSDLVFDHSAAARDLGFRPRGFKLSRLDVNLRKDSERMR